MQKVIVNKCYGGFGFSKEFMAELFRRYPGDRSFWGEPEEEDACMCLPNYAVHIQPFCPGYSRFEGTICFREDATNAWFRLDDEGYTRAGVRLRSDPRVVALFEEWQETENDVNGMCAKLYVETVPEHWNWRVADYDGMETLEKEFPWKVVLNELLEGKRIHPLTQKLLDEKLTVEQYIEQVQPYNSRWY